MPFSPPPLLRRIEGALEPRLNQRCNSARISALNSHASDSANSGLLRVARVHDADNTAKGLAYWVAGEILTVSNGMGGKSKQVGWTRATILAAQLLQRFAKQSKA
jgi:hypothetical protein